MHKFKTLLSLTAIFIMFSIFFVFVLDLVETLNSKKITYFELLSNLKNKILKENNVTSFKLDSYEDQIEVWHRKEEDSVSLHKFLGLTWRQYQILNQSGSVFN